MKKTKFVAIVAGVMTFILFLVMSGNRNGDQGESIERQQVLVAATDIAPLTIITEDMITLSEIEVSAVHPDAIQQKEDAVGKIAGNQIYAGEQFLHAKLNQDISSTGLAYQVSEGNRAITVLTETDTGIGNMLRPGNRVDLVTTIPSDLPEDLMEKYNNWITNYPEYFALMNQLMDQIGNGNAMISSEEDLESQMGINMFMSGTQVTKSILLYQNLRVLAVDSAYTMELYQNSIVSPENYISVTLEVSPEQAVGIHLAETGGAIRMILRNQEDDQIVEREEKTYQDLMQGGQEE